MQVIVTDSFGVINFNFLYLISKKYFKCKFIYLYEFVCVRLLSTSIPFIYIEIYRFLDEKIKDNLVLMDIRFKYRIIYFYKKIAMKTAIFYAAIRKN